VQVEGMRVIGGGANGRTWRQILADVYAIPVLRPKLLSEATSLGAALAGGVGVGLYPDFRLAEELTPIVDTALPNPAHVEVYQRAYRVFNKAYETIEPVFAMMKEL
jgi:xylulokinase